MNLNIVNQGEYRATDYGKGSCSLFNRRTDQVMNITKPQFDMLMEDRDTVYWAMYEAMWLEALARDETRPS
jgi:hypothetical protein